MLCLDVPEQEGIFITTLGNSRVYGCRLRSVFDDQPPDERYKHPYVAHFVHFIFPPLIFTFSPSYIFTSIHISTHPLSTTMFARLAATLALAATALAQNSFSINTVSRRSLPLSRICCAMATELHNTPRAPLAPLLLSLRPVMICADLLACMSFPLSPYQPISKVFVWFKPRQTPCTPILCPLTIVRVYEHC